MTLPGRFSAKLEWDGTALVNKPRFFKAAPPYKRDARRHLRQVALRFIGYQSDRPADRNVVSGPISDLAERREIKKELAHARVNLDVLSF